MKINSYFGRFLIIFVIFNAILPVLAHNYPIYSDSNCIRSIIGESGGESYKGMLAVASVIRNRGSLQGVYGYYSKQIDKQPKSVWIKAQKAWNESATNNILPTCKYWGGKMDKSYFEIKLKKKPFVVIGNQSFYE